MYFRTDREGLPLKRSFLGNREIYEDIKHKKIAGKAAHPTILERTEDYAKDMHKKTVKARPFQSTKSKSNVRTQQGRRPTMDA